MATIKTYTDIEQSKKLAEILPLESADMRIGNYVGKSGKVDGTNIHYYTKGETFGAPQIIEAWSLAALLDVLPLSLYDESDSCDYELEINMIDKMPRYIRLGEMYHSQFPYDFKKDTLLDNIVESIIWLNDNNYFEL